MNPQIFRRGRLAARRLAAATWAGATALAVSALDVSAAPGHPVQKCVVNGGIVFQSAPCLREAAPATPAIAAAAGTTTTAATTAIPARSPVAEPPRKRKTLAETLREHDAGERGAAPGSPPAGNGFNVLQDRMGAR